MLLHLLLLLRKHYFSFRNFHFLYQGYRVILQGHRMLYNLLPGVHHGGDNLHLISRKIREGSQLQNSKHPQSDCADFRKTHGDLPQGRHFAGRPQPQDTPLQEGSSPSSSHLATYRKETLRKFK